MKKTVISRVHGPPLYCTWNVFYCRIETQLYPTVDRDQAHFLSDQPLLALLSAVIESLFMSHDHASHWLWLTKDRAPYDNLQCKFVSRNNMLVEKHSWLWMMVVLMMIVKKTEYSNCPKCTYNTISPLHNQASRPSPCYMAPFVFFSCSVSLNTAPIDA